MYTYYIEIYIYKVKVNIHIVINHAAVSILVTKSLCLWIHFQNWISNYKSFKFFDRYHLCSKTVLSIDINLHSQWELHFSFLRILGTRSLEADFLYGLAISSSVPSNLISVHQPE